MRLPLPDRHPRDSYKHMLMQMHMAVFTVTLFIKKKKREREKHASKNKWNSLQQFKNVINNWDSSYKCNVILKETMS